MAYRRTLIDNQTVLQHIINNQPTLTSNKLEKDFNKVDKFIDLKYENETSYWCEDCDECFPEQSQLDKHKCLKESISMEEKDGFENKIDFEPPTKKKVVRKRLEQPIVCKCSKVFYYRSYYNFHYKDVHEQKEEVCS